MSRQCSVCASPHRQRADAALSSGSKIAEVAVELGISESALYRHRRAGHLGRQMLKARGTGAGEQSPGDLLGALWESLADIRAVRGSALSRGDSGLLLRAARESHEIVKTALVQLGISDLQVAEELKSAERLATAVGYVAQRSPEVGLAISVALRDQGELAQADELQRVAEQAARRHHPDLDKEMQYR